VDLTILQKFEETIRKDIPDFKIVYKDQSKFMKLLGFLVYPFNPQFMDMFTTTIGNTIYFPTATSYTKSVASSLSILAHEYVHLYDSKPRSLWFKLSYLFPQILVVLPLIVYAVLSWPHMWILLVPFAGYILGALVGQKVKTLFWVILGLFLVGTFVLAGFLTGWKLFVLLGALSFLAPWPAPWRMKWELRGYSMSKVMRLWMVGVFSPGSRRRMVQQFVGPGYYFMSWSRSHIETKLDEADAETLQAQEPYKTAYDFLCSHDLVANER
jgi:hypothetical protein